MQALISSITQIFTTNLFLYSLLGVAAGMVIGTLPGLSATMGIAIMTPLTFWLEPSQGMAVLLGIYNSAIWSGGISAILLNTPGTPASISQTFDGYALVKNGEANKALNINTIFSVIGGVFSTIVLTVAAFPIARFALKFGPPEMFALALFGLSMMVGVSGEYLIKGLFAGIFGFLLSTVGLDPMFSVPRYTFNNINLLSGIPFVVMMIGMFGVGEIMYQMATRRKEEAVISSVKSDKSKKSFLTAKEWKTVAPATLISCVISVVVGAIPGTGGDIASIICWQQAKNISKDPNSFGKGNLEGLCAASTANNAVIGGAMTTMMTLGLPGDGVTAILIGSLMMYGMQPGPRMFVEQADFVYKVFGLMFVGYLMILVLGLLFSRACVLILKLKQEVIWVIVLGFCILGSYSLQNNVFDVVLMFVAGILGYICKCTNIPLGPFILGLLLGPTAESNFRRSLALSQGNYSIFFTRPIVLVLFALTILSLVVPVINRSRKAKAGEN